MSCTDSCLIGSDTWLPGNQSSSVSCTGLTSPWASNRALRNTAVSAVRTRESCEAQETFNGKTSKAQRGKEMIQASFLQFYDWTLAVSCGLNLGLQRTLWSQNCCELDHKYLSTDPVFHFKRFLTQMRDANVAVLHVVFIVINHCFTLYCITQKRLFWTVFWFICTLLTAAGSVVTTNVFFCSN